MNIEKEKSTTQKLRKKLEGSEVIKHFYEKDFGDLRDGSYFIVVPKE